MKVLMHFTTSHSVFRLLSRAGTYPFTHTERIKEVSDFYNRYHRSQRHLYFIVSFFDLRAGTTSYSASNILFDEKTNIFKYSKVSLSTKNLICNELGLNGSNTYDNESFYRTLTIEGSETEFENNKKDSDLNKIKMKFLRGMNYLIVKRFYLKKLMKKSSIKKMFLKLQVLIRHPLIVLKI